MRSDYIKTEFWPDYCSRIFGANLPPLDIEGTQKYYGGLDITGSNIYFINSIEDPWQYASMRELTDPEGT